MASIKRTDPDDGVLRFDEFGRDDLISRVDLLREVTYILQQTIETLHDMDEDRPDRDIWYERMRQMEMMRCRILAAPTVDPLASRFQPEEEED